MDKLESKSNFSNMNIINYFRLLFGLLICGILPTNGQPPSMSTMARNFKMDEFKIYNDSSVIILPEREKISALLQISRFDTSIENVNKNYKLYKLYFGDSLQKIFSESANDTIKAEALSTMAVYITYDSVNFYFDSTIAYIDKAMSAKNQKFKSSLFKQKIHALNYQASFNWNMENYLKSFTLVEQIINLIESVDSLSIKPSSIIINNVSKFYGVDNQKLNKYLTKAEVNIKSKNLPDSTLGLLWTHLTNAYMQVSIMAMTAENYADAKNYAKESERIFENIPVDFSGKASTKYMVFNNLGKLYEKQQEMDSAIYFYRKALLETINHFGDSMRQSSTVTDIGKIHYENSNYDSALIYFNMANLLFSSFKTKFNLGKTYLFLNDNRHAEICLLSAIDTLNKNPIIYLSQTDSLEIANVFSDLYKIKLNYKSSLEIYKRFVPKYITDKLWQDAKVSRIKSSFAQLKYEKQKQQFELENKLKSEQEQKQRIVNITLLGSSGGMIVLLIFAFVSVKNKRKRDIAELSEQVTSVEMKSLRSQMNPHFIFNSLQSIQNFLIGNKSDDANDYLLKFSKLMRLVLENSMQQEVPLRDDILALDLYMQLEQLRFTRPFGYEIIVEDSVNPEVDTIPPLLLQPFVENAIWHGLQYKSDPGKIMIRFKKEKDTLICVVEDNGVGRSHKQELKNPVMKKESLGMKLTSERIHLLQKVRGVKATLQVMDLFNQENKPAGTRIEVLLPLAG